MKEIEKIEKLLINVDMVNGFVKKGPMSDNYIEHIIPKIKELMNKMKKENQGIAIIKDNHKKNCREFSRYPEHCIEQTDEAELIDEFKEFEKDSLVYTKNSTSAIYAQNFIDDINKMEKLEEVIIVGCCTDICVLNLAIPLQNYFDQIDKDVNIKIYRDAVETYDSNTHSRNEYNEIAFKLMKQSGIQII
jgi:nicotinamidase-related amidase